MKKPETDKYIFFIEVLGGRGYKQQLNNWSNPLKIYCKMVASQARFLCSKSQATGKKNRGLRYLISRILFGPV